MDSDHRHGGKGRHLFIKGEAVMTRARTASPAQGFCRSASGLLMMHRFKGICKLCSGDQAPSRGSTPPACRLRVSPASRLISSRAGTRP